ncbi:hypothetical protein SDC9_80491 [bioreactor metagenome]|uniref:Uncharacterized protein n=1 Tax=bioreactor metagenome TaxID=1076179 RepID=A0A644YZ77_9ZZZZ
MPGHDILNAGRIIRLPGQQFTAPGGDVDARAVDRHLLMRHRSRGPAGTVMGVEIPRIVAPFAAVMVEGPAQCFQLPVIELRPEAELNAVTRLVPAAADQAEAFGAVKRGSGFKISRIERGLSDRIQIVRTDGEKRPAVGRRRKGAIAIGVAQKLGRRRPVFGCGSAFQQNPHIFQLVHKAAVQPLLRRIRHPQQRRREGTGRAVVAGHRQPPADFKLVGVAIEQGAQDRIGINRLHSRPLLAHRAFIHVGHALIEHDAVLAVAVGALMVESVAVDAGGEHGGQPQFVAEQQCGELRLIQQQSHRRRAAQIIGVTVVQLPSVIGEPEAVDRTVPEQIASHVFADIPARRRRRFFKFAGGQDRIICQHIVHQSARRLIIGPLQSPAAIVVAAADRIIERSAPVDLVTRSNGIEQHRGHMGIFPLSGEHIAVGQRGQGILFEFAENETVGTGGEMELFGRVVAVPAIVGILRIGISDIVLADHLEGVAPPRPAQPFPRGIGAHPQSVNDIGPRDGNQRAQFGVALVHQRRDPLLLPPEKFLHGRRFGQKFAGRGHFAGAEKHHRAGLKIQLRHRQIPGIGDGGGFGVAGRRILQSGGVIGGGGPGDRDIVDHHSGPGWILAVKIHLRLLDSVRHGELQLITPELVVRNLLQLQLNDLARGQQPDLQKHAPVAVSGQTSGPDRRGIAPARLHREILHLAHRLFVVGIDDPERLAAAALANHIRPGIAASGVIAPGGRPVGGHGFKITVANQIILSQRHPGQTERT